MGRGHLGHHTRLLAPGEVTGMTPEAPHEGVAPRGNSTTPFRARSAQPANRGPSPPPHLTSPARSLSHQPMARPGGTHESLLTAPDSLQVEVPINPEQAWPRWSPLASLPGLLTLASFPPVLERRGHNPPAPLARSASPDPCAACVFLSPCLLWVSPSSRAWRPPPPLAFCAHRAVVCPLVRS